jgi:hypothetical protein
MSNVGALEVSALPGRKAGHSSGRGAFEPAAPILGLRLGHWTLMLSLVVMAAPVLSTIARGPTIFDDSYMFWRYAMHLREGLGLAWNPDGIQTYGLTSHLWVLATLPFTWAPLHPGVALPVASMLAGMLAMGVMGLAVAHNASSAPLRDRALAISLASLPLLVNPFFSFHLSTGMDTMLSLAAHAAVVAAVLHYLAAPDLKRACAVGVIAFAAVLTRPENGLVALGVPFLAFVWQRRPERWLDLTGLTVLPVLLIGGELVACYLVFGVPLPLSFYAKSLHIYAGFVNPENAVQNLFMAVAMALPFIAAAIACGRKRDIAFLVVFLLPVAVTFAYLLTMRQVMGWIGRYYLPFLPYLVIPALLLLDRRLTDATGIRPVAMRIGLAFAALLAVAAVTWPIQRAVEATYMKAILPERIPTPPLPTIAAPDVKPPKRIWFDVIRQLADEIVAPLPKDAVIAASEVGYLGAAAHGKALIDLVGLNDTTIGRKGFSMDYLLSRKPDLIWMPSDDYTGLISAIYSDPRLFERYTVVRNAFNYGLAIRRDSPYAARIEASARASWAALYPDHRFDDFIVRK